VKTIYKIKAYKIHLKIFKYHRKIPFTKFLHHNNCKRGDFVGGILMGEFKFAGSFESSESNIIAGLGTWTRLGGTRFRLAALCMNC
jgi:hypothetical protein